MNHIENIESMGLVLVGSIFSYNKGFVGVFCPNLETFHMSQTFFVCSNIQQGRFAVMPQRAWVLDQMSCGFSREGAVGETKVFLHSLF